MNSEPSFETGGPRRKRSYWTDVCFSEAWENGQVRRLRRWLSGAPGLPLRQRPMLAFGLTDGVLVAVGGSTDGAPGAADGSTDGVLVVAGGLTDGVLAAAGGSTGGK